MGRCKRGSRFLNHSPRVVSLKHDGTDGTVKMANLPVPSVSDRWDRVSRLSVTDGTGRRLLKHDGMPKKRIKNALGLLIQEGWLPPTKRASAAKIN